jgi:hypothetical protein
MMSYKKRTVAGYALRQNGWAFAVLIIAGLALGAIKISASQTASQFAANGVQAVGQVTNMTERKNGNHARTYRLSYTFPTAADQFYNGIQSVSEEFYDAQTVGADIAVTYMPTDPTVSVVEPEKLTKGFWVTIAAALGLIIAGIWGGLFTVSRARASIQLRDTGTVTTTTVISHIIEGKKKLKGHMQWRDDAGKEGRSTTISLADLPPIGATITVFTDPARRQNAVWEGDIGSR